MITWIFGSSSDWSQNLIHNLDGDVLEFGRTSAIQTDYEPTTLKDYIEENIADLDTPDRIIFNINTGVPLELPNPIHNFDHIESFSIFNKWWEDNKNQLFFKNYLVQYLAKDLKTKQHQVCYITSQISADHITDSGNVYDLQMYKQLRAMDYEIIWNQRARGLNAFGICPAANTRPMDWSSFIAQKLQTDDLGKEHWLYGVSEPEHGLDLVKWGDWKVELL